MSIERFKLDGRVALVTGSSKGLGLVMARALAEAGASVAITSRDKEKVDSVAASLSEFTGKKIIGIQADVTQVEQVDAMVKTVVDTFGRLDILINNAGINVRKTIENFDVDSWDLVQGTNLKAPFLCARAASKQMKKQKYGRIINMASMLGEVALPERAAYCSSKGGLIQLTKVMALEWAPYNITANAICPGPFATEMNQAVIENPEANSFFIKEIALGRWGDPEELCGAAIYLSSDASSFMTGSSLVIDGGWTAH